MVDVIRMGIIVGCVAVAGSAFATDYGRPYERASLSLNGTWQVVKEHGDDEMWKPEVAAAQQWADAQVPGSLINAGDKAEREGTRFVWARRTFTLDGRRAMLGAVLRWGGIRFGAAAWLNGQKICEHTAVGPNTVMIPAGVTKAGENVLLLKVPGWAGVAKSKSGYPLMPVGGSTQSWGGKNAAVTFDVWMEFYDTVYIKRVLAMPDLKAGAVTFRVWLDGVGQLPDKVRIGPMVSLKGHDVVWGVQEKDANVVTRGKSPIDIKVELRVDPWTLDHCAMYAARLSLQLGEKVCDTVEFTFGMRELKVENGNFTLNGKPFRLRGSNLVGEWHWGEFYNENTKAYIVDAAHAANLNCFRTHTGPPPHSWLNVADKYGTFFLAEFPILYNYANFKFTKEEYDEFHRNALVDAEGWVTELWNHPSVAMWVLSNESPTDWRWETGALQELVNALDPTRVTMRTGDARGTGEIVDIHTCGNVSRDSEGSWMERFAKEAAPKDPKRALTNTEYMNRYGDSAIRWLGQANHPYSQLNYAEFCMEHTEAMRRLNYGCVLPYMYAGWTMHQRGVDPWRADYVTPMAASLHSCMAPVLASLDLYDRNFRAGEEMTTRVVLINETLKDVSATLDLYVTPKDPMLVPDEGALKSALSHQTFSVTMKPASMTDMPVKWTAPAKEGCYWLALVTTRKGDRPVVSQRVVRAVGPSAKEASLRGRKVILLGAEKDLLTWNSDRGIVEKTGLPVEKTGAPVETIDADVVVVADDENLSPQTKAAAPALLDWVKSGGRLVVLDPVRWDWTALVNYKPARGISSRAFAFKGATHPALDGIAPEFLQRWNGIPNVIADRYVSGDAIPGARNILWMEDEARPVLTSIPTGKGEIIICLLKIKSRLARGSKDYDPVAERMMVNLLAP